MHEEKQSFIHEFLLQLMNEWMNRWMNSQIDWMNRWTVSCDELMIINDQKMNKNQMEEWENSSTVQINESVNYFII